MRIFVCVLWVITFISPSFAATGGSGFVEIKQLRFGGGFTRVSGMTNFIDPSDCNGLGTNTNSEMIIKEDTLSYKEIVSTLLMAKSTNTPVGFWVNGCEMDSGNQYPSGRYIYIQ